MPFQQTWMHDLHACKIFRCVCMHAQISDVFVCMQNILDMCLHACKYHRCVCMHARISDVHAHACFACICMFCMHADISDVFACIHWTLHASASIMHACKCDACMHILLRAFCMHAGPCDMHVHALHMHAHAFFIIVFS